MLMTLVFTYCSIVLLALHIANVWFDEDPLENARMHLKRAYPRQVEKKNQWGTSEIIK